MFNIYNFIQNRLQIPQCHLKPLIIWTRLDFLILFLTLTSPFLVPQWLTVFLVTLQNSENNLLSWTTGSLLHMLKIDVSFNNELKWSASWALLSPVAMLYLSYHRMPCFRCSRLELCRLALLSISQDSESREGRDSYFLYMVYPHHV